MMKSHEERIRNVEAAVRAFVGNIKTQEDERFIKFLYSLSFDEKEAYFYIEAQRLKQYLGELYSEKVENFDINSLKQAAEQGKLPLGMNFKKAIDSILQFWDMFGNLPKPSQELRREVIKMHEEYLRSLIDSEKEIFLEC